MKRLTRFLSIFLIMGTVLITVFSIKPKALWQDTNNNPVLTTEFDDYKVLPTERIDTFQSYFIVNYNIPLSDINNKVLTFNKYSVLDSWAVFSYERSEVVIEYYDKPTITRKLDYQINHNTMTESEKVDAYNRFFNSQFLFFNEDLTGVKKITLTLWLDSDGFSKSPPNYLELDYYNDIVYLMPIDELPFLNSFNLKSMKFYFKDYATYSGSGSYNFDFSHIPTTYDFFIFNIGDNMVIETNTTDLKVNSDHGFRLIDRNELIWDIYFTNSFNNENYYFIAYDYNYIINLNDSLTKDIIDAYNTGYNNGYDNGFIDGGNKGVLEGYQNGYDNGYYNGFDDGIISASDNTFYGIIAQVFAGLGSFLSIQLLPGITFGAILSVPLVFGIISFIIGKRGGKND